MWFIPLVIMEWVRWSKEELGWGVAIGKDVVGAVVSTYGEEISKDEVYRVGVALEVVVITVGLMVRDESIVMVNCVVWLRLW
jgi:hypothetical protein